MKIFTLNRGSSSIKCYLYDLPKEEKPLWEGEIEWKDSLKESTLIVGKHKEELSIPSAKKALEILLEKVEKTLSSLDEIDAIGHRIVHGGTFFTKSTLVTEEVKKKIKELSALAPLHNIPELEGIEILEKLLPKKPHVVSFDTAFHSTLPEATSTYPLPYELYKEGIRKYGFHGISYQYCSKKALEMLGDKSKKQVICHLGSGASLCAVKEGISIDTTMGFTPLAGLMMGTRSGTIDSGVLLHLLQEKKMSPNKLEHLLYHESGLLGVSGISADMRDILGELEKGNKRAALAFDIYINRLSSFIAAMAASLEGIDTLIFTAGIGENVPLLREITCSKLKFLGIDLDKEKNHMQSDKDKDISTESSSVRVLIIHTQEAFEIANECMKILSST